MLYTIKQSLWRQFGASIEMLENAIQLCPQEHWDTKDKFWYHTFHCLFFLDYYLTLPPNNFAPPSPFSCSEFEDKMPERIYTKDELLNYLSFCRRKCHSFIFSLDEEKVSERWINESGSMNYSLVEILLYNLRHVQHHAAQLNLLLRQNINDAPDWVFRGEGKVI